MGTHRRHRTLSLAIGILLPLSVLQAQPSGAAAGQTYYVDNTPGSNCDNAHPGTSADAPWCGFTPANAHTFVPGDRLLLARGAVFAEGLSVRGEGSQDAPVTVDAYGEGPRPRIVKNSTNTGLLLNDPSYWTVRNLDIGSTTGGKGDLQYGVRAAFTSPGHRGLVFEDLFIHDTRFVGLHIVNNGPYTTDRSVLQGLRISRLETTHNGHSVVTSTNKSATDLPAEATPGKYGENAFTDLVLDRLYLHDDNNNNGSGTPAQVDLGCPDGLALGNVTNAVVTNSVLRNEASCRTTYGTAAIYLGQARNVLIANNIVADTPNTMNPDMVAIDHESKTSQVTIRGNYFGNNFGGGVEYLAIHGPKDFHVDDRITDNVFADNGVQSHIPYPPDGAVGQLGDDIPVSAELTGNLYHEPFAFLTAKYGGDVSGFTRKNNVAVDQRSDLHHAAQEFGAPGGGGPWGYAMSTGRSWKPLPWNTERDAYASGPAAVDRFTARPAADAAVARTWTAPRAGSVSLRGFALPDASAAGTGGATTVSVTLNNRPLTGTGPVGAAGRATNADDIRVERGDVIRFVATGGAPVSWAPAVGYSADARAKDPAGAWSFSANGDTQGWTSDRPVSAGRGKLEVDAGGASTSLRSPRSLGLDTRGRSALRIRLDNDTRATSGTVTFTTRRGRTGTVPFDLNADETKGLATAYLDLLVPLGDHPAWDGTLSRFTVTFTGATGRVSVDRIALDSAPAKSWDFTDGAEGWTFNPDVSRPSPGRPVPDADVVTDADNSQGSFVQHADIAWNNTRMQTFRATKGSLARLDLWVSRKGEPTGSLFLRVVKLPASGTASAETLFTGSIAPDAVSTTGGMASVHPNLRNLDPDATYGLQIFAPYQAPGGGVYGIGYNDAGLYTAGLEYYSVDANGTWRGPEAARKRSLKFHTFAFADGATSAPAEDGFVPARTDAGKLVGSSGYEPVLNSPGGLGLDASRHRYVRIRMSNPDNRPVGYLLFTTSGDPVFDTPGGGFPPPNEKGGLKGIAFALVPGDHFTEYVLDMATVPGWKGTVDRLKVQPFTRWSYHFGNPAGTWHGAVDHIRVD
ncbi:right-handed parallel beta-helix repeat-containing protein [Streptomyces sp. NBC_00893]|uniref:right-handed parallel beta-helix repeat-containing protein n=1 Tax=Streptomyces sp. NBC_00893 TaxID=2975862 RepID=UPI00225321D6|nr:right-handed parallel beta-helix repeat-containing protein [Streptomyces sp. NBC_00893]MCX4843879.1 right-handed parallel beta-helix repeat-containing protein [Streptomyces sp. NBC_00893]